MTSEKHIRWLSLSEGLSYILLLAVAMPLKYLADMPLAVRIAGSLHGLLFVLLALGLGLYVMRRPKKLALTAAVTRASTVLLVALIPLGALWLESRWKRGASPLSG